MSVAYSDHSSGDRQQVIARELRWHEQESYRRDGLDEFLYAPPAFDPVVDAGIGFLQVHQGDLILDMGAGTGKESLELARRGLQVISADLSHKQLSSACQRMQAQHGLDGAVHFVQTNAEQLPFAPGAFRFIYGKAILHHLDIEGSAREINRLLQADGRATFAEPLARHPMIALARHLTPRLRTPDERPFTLEQIYRFVACFAEWQVEVFFLTAPLAYLLRPLPGGESLFRRAHGWLMAVDRWLFQVFPALKQFAWYALVEVTRTRQD